VLHLTLELTPVPGIRVLACRIGWDHSLAASVCQPVAQLAGVVGAIGDQTLWGRHAPQDVAEADEVMNLARCQAEGQRPTVFVGQGMNLGRPSAARPADGIGKVPPFAPAAERCTLMCVLSAEVVPTTPLEPVSV
jgi:hypothetical protein